MTWLRKAEPEISVDLLKIDFNNDAYDYVVYMPGKPNTYITYIDDFKFGFGPRYLLGVELENVKQAYPERIPLYAIQYKSIPVVAESIVRRLGWLVKPEKKRKRPNVPTIESLDSMQQQYMGSASSPRGWENYAGPSGEDAAKHINRPEENFETTKM